MKMIDSLIAAVVVLAAASVAVMVNAGKPDSFFEANVEAWADDESAAGYVICYSESVVKVGYTYYDCGTCEKVYDEKGRGNYTKCFR